MRRYSLVAANDILVIHRSLFLSVSPFEGTNSYRLLKLTTNFMESPSVMMMVIIIRQVDLKIW